MRPPDPVFADPRLAALYDVLDDDRCDLDAYVDLADELCAGRVVDIGCGTGSLAVRLARTGRTVIGVDPAGASLDIARTKPLAESVTWVQGDATALVGREVGADLVVMTGNVAQVFVSDADWSTTLEAVHDCLHLGGWFVFETRRPEVRDWEQWHVALTTIDLADGNSVIVGRTVTEVAPPLVTFESQTTVGGQVIASASTLRFRGRDEIEQDLSEHGFDLVDVRDAPDRPGKELVFLAHRATGPRRVDAVRTRSTAGEPSHRVEDVRPHLL
ncbi:class I SAM-dependent methyltransferase [Dermatophilaceae bacterium Soc4.6]